MPQVQQSDVPPDPHTATSWRSRTRAVVVGFFLSIAGLVVGGIFSIVPLLVGGTGLAALTGTIALSELGYAVAGWAYARRWFSGSIPLKIPTLKQIGMTLGSTVLVLGVATAIQLISSTTGIQPGRADQDIIAGSPEIVLIMVVLSIILIGPAEEYLFRGVIQGRLRQSLRASVGIGVTGILFVIPHAIGYTGGLAAILLLSLAPFSLAIVMGVLYERTGNLILPMLSHGLYNAVLFGITYATF